MWDCIYVCVYFVCIHCECVRLYLVPVFDSVFSVCDCVNVCVCFMVCIYVCICVFAKALEHLSVRVSGNYE